MQAFPFLLSLIVLASATVPSADDQKQIINEINTIRSQVSPPPDTALPALQWDATLAANASIFADQCTLASAGGAEIEMFINNETATIMDAFSIWASESSKYNYDSNSCSGGGGDACNSYRKIIAQVTTSFGCGMARCQGATNGTFVVCLLSPPLSANSVPYSSSDGDGSDDNATLNRNLGISGGVIAGAMIALVVVARVSVMRWQRQQQLMKEVDIQLKV